MRICLISKLTLEALETCNEIRKYLEERNVEVVLEEETASALSLKGLKAEKIIADFAIVLGGDGMILKAAAKLRDIPLLGINFGTMGFLTEVLPENWKKAIKKLLDGEYTIDERKKLDIFVDGKKVAEALNEAVVITEKPVKMLHLRLWLNAHRLGDIRADGVIVSTPTGSTAYSKSAGGPVVHPRADVIVITPICPFNSPFTSYVAPDNMEVKIEVVESKYRAIVVVDGIEIQHTSRMSVKISDSRVRFVRLLNVNS